MKIAIQLLLCGLLSAASTILKADENQTAVLPFGLKYGMDTTQVNSILDSLKMCNKVVDDDELGAMYVFKNGRRIRLVVSYDPDRGFSQLEMTTYPIFEEYREARIKEIRWFLRNQNIAVNKRIKTSTASSFAINDSCSVHIHGGVPSATFYNWRMNHVVHDNADRNRKYYGTYIDPYPYLIAAAYISGGLLVIVTLWAAISRSIKKRKGLPHKKETRTLKIISALLIIIAFIAIMILIIGGVLWLLLLLLIILAFIGDLMK